MEFGELIDEASERAGLDPAALTHRHLTSARRSFDLLCVDIENAGAQPEYRTETILLPLSLGQMLVALPADTIDVLDVCLRRDGSDLGLSRSTRQQWTGLASKATQGRPIEFWVSKTEPQDMRRLVENLGLTWSASIFGGGPWGGMGSTEVTQNTPAPVLVLWPLCDRPDDKLLLTRVRACRPASMLDDVVDARRNWLEIMAAGLASRLAEKFNVERHPSLEAKFAAKLMSRLNQENEGDVHIARRAFGFARRRRH